MLRFTVIAAIMISTSAQTCTGTAPPSPPDKISICVQNKNNMLYAARTWTDQSCESTAISMSQSYCYYAGETGCPDLVNALSTLEAVTTCTSFTTAITDLCAKVEACFPQTCTAPDWFTQNGLSDQQKITQCNFEKESAVAFATSTPPTEVTCANYAFLSSQQKCFYANAGCSDLTTAINTLGAATTCSAFASAYDNVCNEIQTCYAPQDDLCFPGTALVTLADGTLSRIDALKEGTSILSATTEGGITTDTVTLLSIVKPEATAKFLTFTTANNKTLTLTPEHHLPVGPTCCSIIRKAKDVPIGATVWMVEAAELTSVLITSKEIVNAVGLHSPVLSKGGLPIVNGFVTSFDSIEKVTIARYGLTFLLKACAVTGTCEYLRSLFN